MKKVIAIIAIVSATLIPFGGCKKFVDHYLHRDSTVVSNCRIAKVIQRDETTGEVRTGTVYYNDHNDPDSVIFDAEFYGPTLFYFRYNNHHQLIEYREDYDRRPDFYFAWHKYIYENGIAVQDTARFQVAGQSTEVRNIEYDLNKRVVRESRHLIELDHDPADEEAEPLTYKYDESGNLEGETFVYDGMINFLRTNKVWMFTQRNYSMNNRVGATSYNEHGLPLEFETGKGPLFLLQIGVISSIEYECKAK